MSLGRRAYNLLRAYIGREWERIESASESSARRELEEYLESPAQSRTPPASPPPAAEQGQGAVSEIGEAYRVLGLPRSSGLEEVKRAYKRLSERSLPLNFPEGSEERKKAALIHLRVQEAYDLILPLLDARLRRFRSLDIE